MEVTSLKRESSEKSGDFFYFGHNTRYIVLLICTVSLTLLVSNSLALNFTVICMRKQPLVSNSEPEYDGSQRISRSVDANDFGATKNYSNESLLTVPLDEKSAENSMFSLSEQAALFSATAVGSFIGTLPITYLTSNFGVRRMFTGYGLLSALATLLTPLSTVIGFWTVFAMRVIQGFGIATSFVAMGAVSAAWSPLKTSGMYVAWISCHLQFGPMFTMPIAGELCESKWGWESVYYLQGVLTIIVFALFYYFYRDSPRFQRNVSEKELTKIEAGKAGIKTEKSDKETKKVPYVAMLRDRVVWGIIISSAAAQLGFQLFQQYGPTYLNKVLGMNVEKTGISAALPFALSCIVKMLAGPLSDYVPMSDKGRVILFASVSQYAMAACFAALAILPASQITLLQVCFTGATVFSGLNCVGVVKCIQLAARDLSHVIYAWNTLLYSFIVLLMPLFVSLVAPENTMEQWGRIYVAVSILVIAATTLFNFTAEVEPRHWTGIPNKAQIFCVEAGNIPEKNEKPIFEN
ncbi:major facilitator superfamily domain-containing protein [Ditylenchus destructor]|uniref:Major facilitator superfamily domain-containing protein n=1 Tax=Ditylenchus destructor TaxID=166010 RepID=A0AAD4N4V6_9BILA|nr:major facilitator superfamily domain-containing protein [Ditylenchus destructor]